MSVLRKLAGETAIYGMSSILGRMLNFLLTPLYVNVLNKNEYGNVTELFAYTSFLIVIFTYRMETAYFRYASHSERNEAVYSTALISILGSSLVLAVLLLGFAGPLASALHYKAHPEYIALVGLILAFDALCELPFSRLRLEGHPRKFALIKLANIGTNIGFNLFFLLLCPWLDRHLPAGGLKDLLSVVYRPGFGVGYVFLSNALASGLTLLLLLPLYRRATWEFDRAIWSEMFRYAAPLIVVGMAGIVNETLDRAMFKWVSPLPLRQNEALLGEYGAGYKLTMILTLFTQAFRMGAEPFFFKHRTAENAPKMYAAVTKYFSIVAIAGLLATLLYLDLLKRLLLSPQYWVGLKVVPVLLVANLCLGLYYNVSVWYRLADRTAVGMNISLAGAGITILLNLWWIPVFGYMGCAWATLVCYAFMVAACYYLGQRHYHIPYPVRRIFLHLLLGAFIYGLSLFFRTLTGGRFWPVMGINTVLMAVYVWMVYRLEGSRLRRLFAREVSPAASSAPPSPEV